MVPIRDIFGEIESWRDESIAIARVVRTQGSAPRAPGAAMVVNADGRVTGSVSGGCVEGAVVAEALEVIDEDRPRLVRFGYSDDEGFAVGLTCGGIIDVFIAPGRLEVQDELESALSQHEPVVLATVLSTDGAAPKEPGARLVYRPDAAPGRGTPRLGASLLLYEDGQHSGELGNDGLDRSVVRDAAGALALGRSAIRHYGRGGEARDEDVTVFFEVFAPPPRMVIIGAVDFTAALTRVAKILGFAVTVCDARATFATAARFPQADSVVVEWPDRFLEREGASLTRRDALCVLTHDPKFDIPALLAGLKTDVGYLGAMGSRHTHERRIELLGEEGASEEELGRIMAPIGLDLGAATPEETAVAICAEIIATRNGRVPTSLRDSSGPIHAPFDLRVAP